MSTVISTAHAGHVFIPSNHRVRAEYHPHKCPLCKVVVPDQPNSVCQKCLPPDMTYHTFPCMRCMADWRRRFGLNDLVDALVDVGQAQRFRHEYPEERVAQREEREATVDRAVAEMVKEPT